MKFLAWIGGILATVIVAVYVVAFTPIGNSIVQPIVEEKIKEQTLLDSKLNVFSLSMSELEIVLEINNGNVITLKGEYSLIWKSFDIDYRVELNNLESLKSLSGVELRKSFFTSGNVKGDMAFINIDGVSDVASSDTSYHVELTEFNPTSIIAKVDRLKLDELLDIGAQKPYASADVNLDVDFKNIKPHALDGDIVLRTEEGKINTKVMKKDFNITIPSTDFAMNLDAKLKGDDVDYSYKLMSNLFKITSSGKVIPTPLKTDIKYALDIKELALLKPVTGADVRGSFRLNGTVKGTKAKLVVNGKSDVASSDTRFEAILKEFAPASVKASMKNLKLARVLYMVKQPHYADGIFSLDVNIPDARSGKLNGKVISSLKKGLVDAKYMTKAYKFKTPMPQTAFQMTTNTTLNGDIIDSKIDLDSTLANFDIKRARFNVNKGSIVSDYKATVQNLDKLYFATEQHMKGGITVNGGLKKEKDLDLTILSNVASGKIKDKLQLLINDVKKGDTIYFYYNGHGVPDPSKGAEPYILPQDKIPDFITKESDFALKNIYLKLSNSKADKVIAFIDSCFSGATDGISLVKGVAAPRIRAKNISFNKEKMVVLSAGRDTQYSNMYEEKGHRMFSYFLMQSMLKGRTDINKIYSEVNLNVSDTSNELGALKKQEPTIRGNSKLTL